MFYNIFLQYILFGEGDERNEGVRYSTYIGFKAF
jgi:hypothetical protein